MKKFLLIVCLLGAYLLVGCQKDVVKTNQSDTNDNIQTSDDSISDENNKNVIENDAEKKAKDTPQVISIDSKKANADVEAGAILLDVRTYEEYSEKHIKGSILIPNTEIEERASKELPDKDAEIIVYCASGIRAKSASEALMEMGYKKIYDLGSIDNWTYGLEYKK